MDSFPTITDLTAISADQQKEKAMIDNVLNRFARVDVSGPHLFHAYPSRKLTDREKEKDATEARALRRAPAEFQVERPHGVFVDIDRS